MNNNRDQQKQSSKIEKDHKNEDVLRQGESDEKADRVAVKRQNKKEKEEENAAADNQDFYELGVFEVWYQRP